MKNIFPAFRSLRESPSTVPWTSWHGRDWRQRLLSLREKKDFGGREPKYRARLEEELTVIKSMGFAGYFLIVADFIHFAKSRGIPVGPGRGSAAGSLVAYSLNITDLDPIEYDLIFERFLNPGRKSSMPDVDVDFCMEGRDDVIHYVMDKYGKENVAQIITFGKMQARAVIRDVGRVMDIPYAEVDRIAKLIPGTLNITLDQALEQEPRLRELWTKTPGWNPSSRSRNLSEGLGPSCLHSCRWGRHCEQTPHGIPPPLSWTRRGGDDPVLHEGCREDRPGQIRFSGAQNPDRGRKHDSAHRKAPRSEDRSFPDSLG